MYSGQGTTRFQSTLSFQHLVYWLVLALWALLSAQCLSGRANIPHISLLMIITGQDGNFGLFVQSDVTSSRMLPVNLNSLQVIINTLCFYPIDMLLSDKSTELLVDYFKCHPLSYLNPLLYYCLVIKRGSVRGCFSNRVDKEMKSSFFSNVKGFPVW